MNRILWQRLHGKIAEALYNIPLREDALGQHRGSFAVADEVVQYLNEHVVGTPWADQLVLMAVVISLCGMSENTIFAVLWSLHPRFRTYFKHLSLRQWMRRMDQIEAYQADEERVAHIRSWQ